jgi:hypothetical protein
MPYNKDISIALLYTVLPGIKPENIRASLANLVKEEVVQRVDYGLYRRIRKSRKLKHMAKVGAQTNISKNLQAEIGSVKEQLFQLALKLELLENNAQ